MRDDRDEVDYIKVDLKSFQDMARTIEEQKAQIEFLQKENKRLLTEHRDLTETVNWEKRQNAALKFRCSSYSKTINELESEIADMKFTNNFLPSEDAGKMFARSLGVGQ